MSEHYGSNPQPRPEDTVLQDVIVKGARKTFWISLRQNHGGKFLKLREKKGEQVHVVIIPEEMIDEVLYAIKNAAKLAKQ